MEKTNGILYLVASPIGNLEDITLRALRVLREAGIIACEDTRKSRILLNRYDISSRLVSYYGAMEKSKTRVVLKMLREGYDVALLSEAGTPGISDPGYLVVKEAVDAGIRVVPIPGPCAAVAAVTASGLPVGRFCFEGFLPKKRGERRERLVALAHEPGTIIIYESPLRLRETLEELKRIAGDRRVVIAREMTKIHEEFIFGTPKEILETLGEAPVKGECVILLEGKREEIDWSKVDLPAYVAMLCDRMDLDEKRALKLTAELSGLAKSVIYRELHRS